MERLALESLEIFDNQNIVPVVAHRRVMLWPALSLPVYTPFEVG